MGKINIDLSSIRAAGIYTIELDNTQREITNPTSLRLLPGFNNKGPFNRPVFLQYESERQTIFGDIDHKLEQKGCFFNRMAQTMLKNGPVLALNLLKVDESVDGPDQVNYAAMSLDSNKPNPKVKDAGKKYGEYDYQASTIDNILYDTSVGDNIPYVGKTPFPSLFDRSRFWIPSKHNLQAVAANGLTTNDDVTFEHTNLLNFANTGTDEISILVFRPEGIKGYDITAKEWWGGEENIPYGWIRPSDYISDYFIRVVAVKGNWTNYQVLSNDPIWHKYFDKNGIIKDKIGTFCSAEGITFIGSWTGILIPHFVDKQGNYLYIEDKVNAVTERTGLLMSVNEDALQVISYDKNGVDVEVGCKQGKGTWVYDFDENAQAESELGEGMIEDSGYLIDMVGHNLQQGIYKNDLYINLADPETGTNDDKKYPTTWFLKTEGKHDGKYIYPLLLNNRESQETDLPETAKIRVLTNDCNGTTLTGKQYAKAYVVIDCSTNMPIRGNGMAPGVKTWYIISTKDISINKRTKKISIAGAEQSSTDLKTYIIGQRAYGQQDKNISYHVKDASFIYNGRYDGYKTINDILNTIEKDPKHYLTLREVPVIADTNDNFVYMDASCYYGTYALLKPVSAAVNSSTVQIFSVTGGLKAGSYATIQDVGTITEFTALNNLNSVTATAENPIKTKTGGTETENTSGNYYEFSFDGNEYLVQFKESISTSQIFKKSKAANPEYFGVNFLSYNYITENIGNAISYVSQACYFNGYANDSEISQTINIIDTAMYQDSQEIPVPPENLNTFIITNEREAKEISIGDYVNNITFYNNIGEAELYNLIPGVTRIIAKVFVNVDARLEFYYKGKKYKLNLEALPNGQLIETRTGKRGFYLFTALDPVYISKGHMITRQLAITNDVISHNLKFIPLKGLHISAKHRPGFDEYGKIDIEAGIEKIYSMLEDDGIHRGLCNPNMIEYRYIVDSMSYGLNPELGGKVYLSRLAQDRMKTTALLNLPSKRQFELSQNPCFCETYEQGIYTKPPFDTKYIPMGGNSDLYNTKQFTLPTEDDGSKFSAAFWPHLIYTVNGRNIMVPPAADVCDVFIHKFNGGDPYVIAANRNGIIRNPDVTGVEFMADTEDREYLEPFGVNTIIQERNEVLIYGNQTCYQNIKSDYNKLHVRENLNTLEIACESVLKSYNFLYNTAPVRASIVTALTPILEAMKLSQAIEKYEIVCDESNNTPEIIQQDFGIVDIAVWMNHGMEKIVQRITLNRRDTLGNNA